MSGMDSSTNLPYSDRSPFVRLLETPGRVRILDVFLRKHYTELSASDVANLGNIDKSTFTRNKDVLLELEIIVPSDKEGQQQYYRLNTDSEIVNVLGRAHSELTKFATEVNDKTTIDKADYIGRLIVNDVNGPSSEPNEEEIAVEKAITENVQGV